MDGTPRARLRPPLVAELRRSAVLAAQPDDAGDCAQHLPQRLQGSVIGPIAEFTQNLRSFNRFTPTVIIGIFEAILSLIWSVLLSAVQFVVPLPRFGIADPICKILSKIFKNF